MIRKTPGIAFGVAVAAAATATVLTAGAAPAAPHPDTGAAVAAEKGRVADAASALGLSAGQRLVVRSVMQGPHGASYIRYDRTYNGLRVIGGDLVVSKNAQGKTTSVKWNNTPSVAVSSIAPTISGASARGVGAQAAALSGEKSTSELVVFAAEAAPRLAYDVVTTGVQADQTPSRLHTIVDAKSGKTLDSYDDIADGTGNTMYSGTVTLNTTISGGTFVLKDSHGNFTTDLNGATTGTGTQFTDADDVWGNGLASNRQTAGADAQFGAEKTYDFYNTVLGRAGIWDNGTGARSRVHYGNAYVNAFWDGTQMTYGDGISNTHPLTSLDVAGHEMSHGVTENTAGLVYRKESGGLNEANSDIFGTAVEWFAANSVDVPDYLIGEKIDIHGDGTPLRYMDKPSRDGSSPDCYSSTIGRLNVHYSSGPLNHWFYLASEGSGAKTINGVSYNSPTCNGTTFNGVGHLDVEKIWYHTLTTKLTSRSGYADAREGAIASAKELYGAGTTQCVAVQKAFNAIAVPAGAQTC